jgi:hypothetical protein
MAATLTQIRQGLAATLSTLQGIQVSPYMLSNATPPAVHLYPGGAAGDITYDLAFQRGLDMWPFTVQAFVGLTSDIGAQVMLDQFIAPSGPQSIKTVMESNPTLGGLVDDTQVVSCTGYRIYRRDGAGPVLGAEWHLTVYASGA